MTLRHLAAFVALIAALFGFTACATAPGAGRAPTAGGTAATDHLLAEARPAPPQGEVAAQGMVIDDGTRVQLCLGAVTRSAPPQCQGIPLLGWSWAPLPTEPPSWVAAGGVRWGAFAVQGTYDGKALTVTRPPVPLALYDATRRVDPIPTGPHTATSERLQEVQALLPGLLGASLLSSSTHEGRVWAEVVWDDGTLQKAADAAYGAGLVVFRTALVPVAASQ